MSKADYLFLAMMTLGLVLGLAYVLIGYGWDNAILYTGVVLFAAGLVGGLRK